MSVTVRTLRGGTNSYPTPPEDFNWFLSKFIQPGTIGSLVNGAPDTGAFAVQAQGTPDMTVKVKAGDIIVSGTPTSESARNFGVTLSADYNVAIPSNSTGSTRYDKIILQLPAATLHNPPLSGDFTEAATIVTERHTAAAEAITATNAIELAEVTVANLAASIADASISDSRVNAVFKVPVHKYKMVITDSGASGSPTWVVPTNNGSFTIALKAGQKALVLLNPVMRLDTGAINQFAALRIKRDGTVKFTGPIVGGTNEANVRLSVPIMWIDEGITADGTYTYSWEFNNTNSVGTVSIEGNAPFSVVAL